MVKQSQTETVFGEAKDIDPIDNFDEYVQINNDAKEFYSISLLTGDISENPTEMEKRQFLVDLEVWKKAGKPKPTKPVIQKGIVKIPTSAYRIRDKGVDKMYVYYNDGTVNGRTIIRSYKKTRDPATGESVTTNEVDNSKPPVLSFDLEFTESIAKGVIEDANKLVSPGSKFGLYFFYKGAKKLISQENFVKSHDNICDMIEAKKAID